jgi:lipid-A-disaccharide synthase
MLLEHDMENVLLLDGQSHEAMSAADTVLMASGTATLEGMLLKKPLVVSYILTPLTAFLVRKMLKQPFVSLPNLLAGKELVPEILQEDATPENLSQAVIGFLLDEQSSENLRQAFNEIHMSLRLDADKSAAAAIKGLL